MPLNVRAALAADVPAILSINERGLPRVSLLRPTEAEAMVRSGECVWVANDANDGISHSTVEPRKAREDCDEEARIQRIWRV